MAVDGAIKEKKRKKKIKEDGVGATAKHGGTQDITEYQHSSVQTTIKTEQSEVNIRKGEQHEYDTTEKKKKKKKKIKEVNECAAVYHDASVQTPVKTELLEINISEGGLEKSDLPQKEKKKKKRKKESEHLQENVMEVTNSEPGEKIDGECLEESRIKKKRKKEKGKKQMEESATEPGEIKKKKKKDVEVKDEVDAGHSGKMKKKKRKNIEDEEQIPESGDGGVKKKRKKTEKNVKPVESDSEPTTKKSKKKEQKASLKTENNKEMKVKVNKEKLSLVEDEMNETDVNTEKRSKKKKKRLEKLDEGQRLVNGTKAKTGDVMGEMRSSKHKMKKGIKLEVDDVIEEERQENKMSKQDMNKCTEKKDVVFLSARPGNQDEISIDQARRLALQEDIDKESQPKPNLGQWSTAQFDSSDKQAKFMRLMGGFKKSSQPITGSSGRANMSLGKEGQQTLQQGLLGEFERAQSRHLDFRNKGIGLGFSPPSNKKFAIDVNARNSIRFDD